MNRVSLTATVAAGILATAFAVFLLVTLRAVDPVTHSRVVTNLSKMQELNSELGEIVLKLRGGLITNYDPIVATLNLIQSYKRDLEHGEHAIVGRGEAEIDRAMVEISRKLAEEEALLEQFKSTHALLKNSLHYFPLSVEALAPDPGVPSAVHARGEALLRDILLLRPDATPADYDRIALAISEMREKQPQHFSPVRAEPEVVLNHAQNVLTYQRQLDRLVQEITAADFRNVSRSLAETYNRSFERKLRQSDLSRFILLLASLGLMTYAAYSFLRLRKNAAQLESAIGAQAQEIAERKRAEQTLRESEERLRTIADNLPALIGYVDSEERYQFVNRTYEAWFGGSVSEYVGRTLREIMPEEDYLRLKPEFDAALAGQVVNAERRTRSRLREQLAHFTFLPHHGADGKVLGFYVLAYDVTERRTAAQVLTRERNLLLSVLDSLPDHVYVKGLDLRYILINAVGRRLRRVESNDEVVGKTAHDFFPSQLAAQFDTEDQAVMASGGPLVNREQSTVDASGERQWHLTTKVPLRSPAGEVLGLIGINRDITERRRAEEQVRIAASALESTAEGVMICDAERRIVSVNKAFTQITGYRPQEVLGLKPGFMRSAKHDEEFYEHIWRQIAETGRWHGEIWRRRKNGESYPEWRSISAVKDQSGATTHQVMVFTDVSRFKQDEARLEFLAHHDALTGLPNRALFQDRCQEALLRAQRRESRLGLIFIDLDHFKQINDSLGHDVGDLLLQSATERLRECVRETDTVARLGGDEFTILLDELQESEDAAPIAEKLLTAIARPFAVGGHELFISASVGISFYPSDGDDVQTLLKNADAAMYRAKALGRNTYQFFAAEMNTEVFERLKLTNSLRVALERDEFLLDYQPVFDLASGRINAVEALLRWKHPELGIVPPGRFISLAENTGLIVPIGEWVLKNACTQMKAWQAKGIAPRRIAVNLSVRQFKQKDLVQRIEAILHETGLASHFLELEITESMVMENPVEAERSLDRLHNIGIRLAVDDFGTGYSSLSYLKRFPVDFLKIDRSFVQDIPDDLDDVAIARAIIALAKALELQVIAEGVETEQQRAFLKAEGCEEAQGYLLGRPIGPEEMEFFLRAQVEALIAGG